MNLRAHPAAEIFPMLGESELSDLAADITAHGQKHPIVVVDGHGEWLILDGRNRAEACRRAGVTPDRVVWSGSDPVAYVLSTNLHRRHLNESQRGMVAVEVERIYAKDAKERQREHGATAPGRQNTSGKFAGSEGEARTKAAKALNVSPRIVSDSKKVTAKAAPEVVAAVRSGAIAVSDAVRIVAEPAAKQAALVASVEAGDAKTLKEAAQKATKAEVVARIQAEPQPLPEGPFRVIVADPPWQYDKRAEDPTHRGANPYPSMSTEAICELPVRSIAHEDAILWLWTTNAFMRDAFRVLDAWGFRERTILTWVKDRMGTGDWLRGKTEHCILAVRGRPAVTLTNQTTVLSAPLREHSRKPEAFFVLVDGLCPGSKLEMFAREPRAGWSSWGAESERFGAAGRGCEGVA